MAAGLGFKTFTTGEVLSAGDTNGYLMQGVLVFATAAARDAAITSPQEGQACYLKSTDAVMTYSGSAWVAVGGSTQASSAAAVATAQSTTSTSYTDLSTVGPSVTLTTGTKALIIFAASCQTGGANIGRTKMAVAISGATTVAAADANAIDLYFGVVATIQTRVGMAYLVTGLTAGSNTFTAKYSGEQSGVSITFANRQISVIDMGS